MRQSDGFQISLLFIRPEETEDEEEETEVAKSWDIGFRRQVSNASTSPPRSDTP